MAYNNIIVYDQILFCEGEIFVIVMQCNQYGVEVELSGRKVILVSAYACETGRGSEGEIAWRLVHELAAQNDVVVVTRANLRAVHFAHFVQSPKPENLSFIYFDLPWIFRFYKKGRRGFLIYYYLWQIGVGLLVRKVQRRRKIDILHHLTGGMDWMPSGLAICPGPFVWGPVGSENTHPEILRHLPVKSRIKDRLRLIVRGLLRTFEPFNRLTGARADIVLSHTPGTMPRRYVGKIRPFTQTGIVDLPHLARRKIDLSRAERLRLVYAGELKDWKGARMALDAALLAFERGVEGELTVIGDGPLRSEMEAAVAAHPNCKQVRFLGRVPMARLVEELHEGDVFLYPSFHHGLATIVLQAMLTGLPIICIEGDATGRAVKDEAGITLRLSQNQAPEDGLAAAIVRLSGDENLRQRLGSKARTMALQDYSYAVLAGKMEAVYEAAVRAKSSQ